MKTIEVPLKRTTLNAATTVVPFQPAIESSSNIITDWLQLTKARLALMVLFTVAIGFFLAHPANISAGLLLHTLFGVGLVIISASTLNQLLEKEIDAKMVRTQRRPLPGGRIQPITVLLVGITTGIVGLGCLAWYVNLLTCVLASITLLSYILIYTPLKQLSVWNTLIGAVAGGLPPVIGWAAATGTIGTPAWFLFAIVFCWQFPHFWAIAWLYRDDYAQADLKMFPILDSSGGFYTGLWMMAQSILLTAISLIPVAMGIMYIPYCLGAILLGAIFTYTTWRFYIYPSKEKARYVLWASLVYLPGIFSIMLIERISWTLT